jgi:hypothetical protein
MLNAVCECAISGRTDFRGTLERETGCTGNGGSVDGVVLLLFCVIRGVVGSKCIKDRGSGLRRAGGNSAVGTVELIRDGNV